MKCVGCGQNCAVLAGGVEKDQLEELTNVLDSLLLQRRLLWKHASNEDGITQSV